MPKSDKFINFLESLSHRENTLLIDSIKQGYLTIFESQTSISWKLPSWKEEIGEFQRYNIDLQLLKEIFDNTKNLTPLSDKMWSELDNTDSYEITSLEQATKYANKYGKDIKSILKAIQGNTPLPAPIIIKLNGSYDLIAGNTRLMVAKALGITPEVLILEDNVLLESENNNQKIIQNFPRVTQSDDYSCGAAVAHAMLVFYGELIFEEDLKKELKTNPETGTDLDEIAKCFKKKKYRIKHGEMAIDEVKQLIDQDIPVIIEIQAWASSKANYETSDANSHFVTVIGYDDKGFICEDPWIEHRGSISYKELNNRWHARASIKDVHLSRPGLAIIGKEPKFSETKIVPIK